MLIEGGRIARMIMQQDKDIRDRSLTREIRTTMNRGRITVEEGAWRRLLELEVRKIEIQSTRSRKERDMSDSLIEDTQTDARSFGGRLCLPSSMHRLLWKLSSADCAASPPRF